MSDKPMSQYLSAELFLKSAVVEKNPDMSFREAVAEFFGVSPEEITRIRRTKDAKGWDITIEGMYEPSREEEDYQWDLGPEEYWDEESEEPEWMTPKDMGIAQKMDWSDDEGNEISDDQKLEYFRSRDDMYEVDEENGLVRLRPEEDWFPEDDEEAGMHEHQVVYDEEAGLVTIYLDGKIQGEQEMLGDYPETEIWKALMEYFPEEDKDELQTIADEIYYNGSYTWYT